MTRFSVLMLALGAPAVLGATFLCDTSKNGATLTTDVVALTRDNQQVLATNTAAENLQSGQQTLASNCAWKVVAPTVDEYQVVLRFDFFETEANYFVTLHDGDSAAANQVAKISGVMKRSPLSGDALLLHGRYRFTGKYAYLKFFSGATNRYSGFKVTAFAVPTAQAAVVGQLFSSPAALALPNYLPVAWNSYAANSLSTAATCPASTAEVDQGGSTLANANQPFECAGKCEAMAGCCGFVYNAGASGARVCVAILNAQLCTNKNSDTCKFGTASGATWFNRRGGQVTAAPTPAPTPLPGTPDTFKPTPAPTPFPQSLSAGFTYRIQGFLELSLAPGPLFAAPGALVSRATLVSALRDAVAAVSHTFTAGEVFVESLCKEGVVTAQKDPHNRPDKDVAAAKLPAECVALAPSEAAGNPGV
eukprot:g7132.t1